MQMSEKQSIKKWHTSLNGGRANKVARESIFTRLPKTQNILQPNSLKKTRREIVRFLLSSSWLHQHCSVNIFFTVSEPVKVKSLLGGDMSYISNDLTKLLLLPKKPSGFIYQTDINKKKKNITTNFDLNQLSSI